MRQIGEPVWMPEISLGIGRQQGPYEGWKREWLYWYDQEGNRFPSPHERLEQEWQRAGQERQRAGQERQRAEQERRLRKELIARLRDRGIGLDDL